MLVTVACRTPIENAERRLFLQTDPYSLAEFYRARCDDDNLWLYLAARKEPGAVEFSVALEFKVVSSVERAFTTAHALGGLELPVEPVTEERRDSRRPFLGFVGPLGPRPVYTEQYRIPLDDAALANLESRGLDAMLYGPNGKFRIRCEAELFQVMRKRIDGE